MTYKNVTTAIGMLLLLTLLMACDENIISGSVFLNGQPVKGVTVTLKGDSIDDAMVTKDDGKYQFFVQDGDYAVAASGQGLSFSPDYHEIHIQGMSSNSNNFIADLIVYPNSIAVAGTAFLFFFNETGIADAQISVLEFPGRIAYTDSVGNFSMGGLPAGSQATFLFSKPGYPDTATKTFILPEEPLFNVFFQVPFDLLYDTLCLATGADPNKCHLVTTVTRTGVTSVLAGGLENVKVRARQVDPLNPLHDQGVELGPEHGPIYFSSTKLLLFDGRYIAWPDKEMTETDRDGGVLFINVPKGTYRLSGEREGYEFEPILLKCGDSRQVSNAAPVQNLQGKR